MAVLESRREELDSRTLKVVFGAPEGDGFGGDGALRLSIPCLGGSAEENLSLVGSDLQVGAECVPLGADLRRLEQVTREAYDRVLRRTAGRSLCRIWNYVPHINACTAGLENYRAFSRARAAAFEAAWGGTFTSRLPAASAVGGPPGMLVVIFAAAPDASVPVENPEQVPAYRYPSEHGPRSPSFSRATRVAGAVQDWVFISGTAAIKGHRSVSPGELEPQIACMLDNLRLVAEACRLGPDLGRAAGWRRRFKVYLRHASDFPAARAALERTLLIPGDDVTWLQADICRAELQIEIEAALARPR